MSMPTLFDAEVQRPLTMKEQFCVFHVQNPQVFRALEEMTEQMVKRGRKHLGLKMMVEVLRFNYYLTTSDPNSEFKVSNNYTSHYARLLIDVHPEWAGLFELRERHHNA